MKQTGLSAEHVFRRTRQLVMASTNDQQVPWEASSLTGDFFFSAEKAEAPAPAAAETTGPSEEMVFWQSIQSRDDPAAFRGYLEQYPGGTFAVLARANLKFLERQEKAKDEELKRQEEEARRRAELETERLRVESERLQLVSKKAEMAAAKAEAPSAEFLLWQSIKDSSDPANYQDYLSQFPDGAFAEVAKRRKARYAAQQLAALRQQPAARAPSRVALALPPPPSERVKFGTATLVVTWANGRRRDGSKETIWPGYDVFTTDTLQTVSNGALHVAFGDGAMLRIGASADAIVESFGPDRQTGNPGVALALTKGVLRFSAGASDRASATVRTPAAVMRLNSTDFMVEVASDKSTRVLLIAGEGSLASTLGGAAVLLSPGTTVTMTKEAPGAILDRLASLSTDAEEVAVVFSQDLGITEKGQNIEEFAGGDGSGDGDGGDGGGDH